MEPLSALSLMNTAAKSYSYLSSSYKRPYLELYVKLVRDRIYPVEVPIENSRGQVIRYAQDYRGGLLHLVFEIVNIGGKTAKNVIINPPDFLEKIGWKKKFMLGVFDKAIPRIPPQQNIFLFSLYPEEALRSIQDNVKIRIQYDSESWWARWRSWRPFALFSDRTHQYSELLEYSAHVLKTTIPPDL